MFNVVIIEDEPLARSKLKRLLQELPDALTVIAELSSVAETTLFLQQGKQVDVIFSDIELTDGRVFQSFQQQPPPCPVIFITAYDQFMLPAFDTFGIAYLLKPYNAAKLAQAWDKFRRLTAPQTAIADSTSAQTSAQAMQQLQALLQSLPQVQPSYPKRIAIRQQQQIYFLEVAEIACVQADGNLVMAFDRQGKRHFLPYASLQAAEAALDPQLFFRLNRSELVHNEHIIHMERYCKNTLAVHLTGGLILKTSQSRTTEFQRWLGL